jgi:hypothetical protein
MYREAIVSAAVRLSLFDMKVMTCQSDIPMAMQQWVSFFDKSSFLLPARQRLNEKRIPLSLFYSTDARFSYSLVQWVVVIVWFILLPKNIVFL